MFVNTKRHWSIMITLKLDLIYCKKSTNFEKYLLFYKYVRGLNWKEIDAQVVNGVPTIWYSNIGD